MKVLQINKFLFLQGGAETYMFQLSKALKERGIDVEYWGMEDEENIVEDTYQSFTKNISYQNQSISNILLNTGRTIYSVSNKSKIGLILDKFQPDIVHLHNYNFQLTPSILPEIKKRGIKIIQTVHDSQMVCPYHRLYNFQKKSTCTKCVTGSFSNCIKDRCFDGSFLKSVIGSVESYFYHSLKYYEKYIDLFVFPSNFLADLIQKKINNKPFEIIPNFSDKIPSIKKNKGVYYLYYGRISNEKGIIELIDIFKDTNLQLVIIGRGDQEKKLVNTINDISNIRYLGPKYGKELFTYVTNAKFVIQPSIWYENCPMTVIESFTYGTPVIASNHSGFKDLIEHNKTGFLLDFTSKENIKKQLLKIDKFDVNILYKNIHQVYNNLLKKELHISKIEDVYNNILKEI